MRTTRLDTKLLRHPAMRDIAFTVARVIDTGPTHSKILVEWYNIGKCHSPWFMNISQVITVDKDFISALKPYNKKAHENESYHVDFFNDGKL